MKAGNDAHLQSKLLWTPWLLSRILSRINFGLKCIFWSKTLFMMKIQCFALKNGRGYLGLQNQGWKKIKQFYYKNIFS